MLDELYAFGERREDLRAAKMTMHLVACQRAAKAGPVKLEEFRLKSLGEREPEPADTADEVRRFDVAAGAKWTR